MLSLTNVREFQVSEEYLAYSKAAIEAAIAAPKPKKKKSNPLPPGANKEAVDELLHALNVAFASGAWADYVAMASDLEDLGQTDDFFPVRYLVCTALMVTSESDLSSAFDELVTFTEKNPDKTDAWLGLAHIKTVAFQFKDAELLLQLAEAGPTPNVAAIASIRQRAAFGLKYFPHSYYFMGYYFWGNVVPEWYKERLPDFDYDSIGAALATVKHSQEETFNLVVNSAELSNFFTAIETLQEDVLLELPTNYFSTPEPTSDSAPILKLNKKELDALVSYLDVPSLARMYQAHPAFANHIGETQALGPLSFEMFGGISNSTPWNAISTCEVFVYQAKLLLECDFDNLSAPYSETLLRSFGVLPREIGTAFTSSGKETFHSFIGAYFVQNFWTTLAASSTMSLSIERFAARFDILGLCLKFHTHQHLATGLESFIIKELLISDSKDALHWQQRLKETGVGSLWKSAVLRDPSQSHIVYATNHALLESRHLIKEENVTRLDRVSISTVKDIVFPKIELDGLFHFAFVPLDYDGPSTIVDLGCLQIKPSDDLHPSTSDKSSKKQKDTKSAAAPNDEAVEGEEAVEVDEEEELEEDEEEQLKYFTGKAFMRGQSDSNAEITFTGMDDGKVLGLRFNNFEDLSDRLATALYIFNEYMASRYEEGEEMAAYSIEMLLSTTHIGLGGIVNFNRADEIPRSLGTIIMWKDPRPYDEALWKTVTTSYPDYIPAEPEAVYASGLPPIGIQLAANQGIIVGLQSLAQFYVPSAYSFVALRVDANNIPELQEEAQAVVTALPNYIKKDPLEPAEVFAMRQMLFAGCASIAQSLSTSNRYLSDLIDDISIIKPAMGFAIHSAHIDDLKTLGYFAGFSDPEGVAASPEAIPELLALLSNDPYSVLVARYKAASQSFANDRKTYLAAANRVLALQLSYQSNEVVVEDPSTYGDQARELFHATGPTPLNPGTPVSHVYYKWLRRFFAVTPSLGSYMFPLVIEDVLLCLGSMAAQHNEENEADEDDMPELEEAVEDSVDQQPAAQLFVSALKKQKSADKSLTSVQTGVIVAATVALAAAVGVGAFFLGRIFAKKK